MENKKLQTKDLITVGIFTALYFALFFATGMLGHIPVLYVFLPFLLPFICGIPFMLFLTKVKSFGMITIMGSILGLLMLLTGHTYVPVIAGFVFGLLADLIVKMSKYKNKTLFVVSYGVFSLWIVGMLVPLWIMKDSYKNMGEAMMKMLDSTYGIIIVLAAAGAVIFIGGVAGAFFGFAMLKKHFKKAGIA